MPMSGRRGGHYRHGPADDTARVLGAPRFGPLLASRAFAGCGAAGRDCGVCRSGASTKVDMMAWFGRSKRRPVATDAAPAVDGATPAAPVSRITAATGSADFVTDAPIDDVREDRFRRGAWARRIAETIAAQRDPASLVVAVYGPWGDGKTSVLNLISESLADASAVVPVRFNPWRLGDEAEMFRGFFATLADALDERVASATERVGQTLRDYGGLLVAVPVVGGALKEGAGAAGAKLSETSLAKQRKKIEDLLAAHGKRVVILIDDIDRLDKSEIQAMFRLVKVAADFKHTAYVLAFDHRVVASALAERYGPEPEHGASFMDKIIQLPLHLPPAPPNELRALALETVDAALGQAGIDLADADARAFVSAFDRAVGPRLTTPRAAKRYGNVLLFALPMIGGEVHPVDLMLVEAMRVCFPRLYEWVRSHEQEVLGPYAGSSGNDHPSLVAIRAAVNKATEGMTEDDAARARTLLTTLLPRTESAWENKGWGGDWDEPWAREKRLASRLYFRRYFTYTVPPGDVADADVDALLEAIDSPAQDDARVAELAVAVFDAGGADTVLPKLAGRVPALGSDPAAHLARVITAVSGRFSEASGFLGLSTLERAAILVRDLLGQVRREERAELAAMLMSEAQHLPFAVEVIRWLRPQGDDDRRAVLTREECDAAGRVLADRLLDLWCSGDPFAALARKAASGLHVCAIYGDGDALRQCLHRRIEADLALALALMRAFLGQAWTETGVPFTPDLHREGYDALRDYVDPDWLVPQLRQRFGAEIGTRGERKQALNADSRLADQYARFHMSDTSAASDVGPDGDR